MRLNEKDYFWVQQTVRMWSMSDQEVVDLLQVEDLDPIRNMPLRQYYGMRLPGQIRLEYKPTYVEVELR